MKMWICFRDPPYVVCFLIFLQQSWEGEGEVRPATAEAASCRAIVVVEGKVFAKAMIASSLSAVVLRLEPATTCVQGLSDSLRADASLEGIGRVGLVA